MKIGWLLILITFTAHGQEPRDRVQFHLKKVETAIQMQHIESKIRALESENAAPRAETPSYIPNFGIGDEDVITESHTCDSSCELPRAFDLQEQIRQETLDRNVSTTDNSEIEKRAFIEEYKKNAAKRGVRVEVDPKTLIVREVK